MGAKEDDLTTIDNTIIVSYSLDSKQVFDIFLINLVYFDMNPFKCLSVQEIFILFS